MEAIKQLLDLAKKKYNDGELIISSNVTIKGRLDVDKHLWVKDQNNFSSHILKLAGHGDMRINGTTDMVGNTYIKNKDFPSS